MSPGKSNKESRDKSDSRSAASNVSANAWSVAQLLAPEAELPSLNDTVTKHFANKTHNTGNAEDFLGTKDGVKIKSTLSLEQKTQLTAALKKTTIIQVLLGEKKKGLAIFEHLSVGRTFGEGPMSATADADDVQASLNNKYVRPPLYQPLENAKAALSKDDFKVSSLSGWQDDKTLVQNAKESDDEEEQHGYVGMGDGGEPAYKENLDKAQEMISTIVQPDVLATVPAPKVVVHRQLQGLPGFRAYAGGDTIHIASDDAVDVIVHEVGHYLEGNLESSLHFDVAVLREKRHAEAVSGQWLGKRKAGTISDEEGETVQDRKGRYKGTYGATGNYTSKAYETIGATEIVSMGMEFMATPEKAKTLVEGDPQQALVILRRLRPNDSQLVSIADTYKDFLPNA